MEETFGERLQRLRKEKGFTQEDIASKVSISPQAVSKWENDLSLPDLEVTSKLADILEVSVDTLLGRDTTNINKEEEPKVEETEGTYINKEENIKVNYKKHNFKILYISSGTLFFLGLLTFILVGIFWKEEALGWRMGWTFILDGLWLGSLFECIRSKKAEAFLYPIFITSLYCKIGFLGSHFNYNGWGIYWFLFLTIPLFYSIIGIINKIRWSKSDKNKIN